MGVAVCGIWGGRGSMRDLRWAWQCAVFEVGVAVCRIRGERGSVRYLGCAGFEVGVVVRGI